jgi:hypothetical protein
MERYSAGVLDITATVQLFTLGRRVARTTERTVCARENGRDVLIIRYDLFQQNDMIHIHLIIELPTNIFHPCRVLDHIHRPRDTNYTCDYIWKVRDSISELHECSNETRSTSCIH